MAFIKIVYNVTLNNISASKITKFKNTIEKPAYK